MLQAALCENSISVLQRVMVCLLTQKTFGSISFPINEQKRLLRLKPIQAINA